MRSISLPLYYRDQSYQFCPISGALLVADTRFRKSPSLPKKVPPLPEKVRRAIELCDNPFLLTSTRAQSEANHAPICAKNSVLGSKVAMRMDALRRRSFLCARLYARYRSPLFRDCAQSMAFFNSVMPSNILSEACLQKSLFAAKTARNFPSDGVLLVGVFLPTTSMHAWIIERDRHPDPTDSAWIMYRPIFAYY